MRETRGNDEDEEEVGKKAEKKASRRSNVIRSDSEEEPRQGDKVNEDQAKDIVSQAKADVPNNAFAKLMQQRKVQLEVVKAEVPVVEMKDSMVTNMLSVLQSVKSDSEGDREVEEERKRNRKERRRRKRSRRSARESSIVSTSSERNSEEEQSQSSGITKTSEEIVRIQCKQVVGSFYPERYVSDTVGLSVQLDKAWYTPKGFQKFIAPKASKFEVNLFVDDLPIQDYFKKRLEVKGEKCEEGLPLRPVNNRGKRRRVPSKRVIRGETEEVEVKEDDDDDDKENSNEIVEEAALEEKEMSSGRRSGRIAKTASILQVLQILCR